jgi:hypothetical protein
MTQSAVLDPTAQFDPALFNDALDRHRTRPFNMFVGDHVACSSAGCRIGKPKFLESHFASDRALR